MIYKHGCHEEEAFGRIVRNIKVGTAEMTVRDARANLVELLDQAVTFGGTMPVDSGHAFKDCYGGSAPKERKWPQEHVWPPPAFTQPAPAGRTTIFISTAGGNLSTRRLNTSAYQHASKPANQQTSTPPRRQRGP